MLQLWPAVTMLTASPELRVEGVKDFDVEPGQWKRSGRRPDVLADIALVTPSGRRVDIEDLQPPVKELAFGCALLLNGAANTAKFGGRAFEHDIPGDGTADVGVIS